MSKWPKYSLPLNDQNARNVKTVRFLMGLDKIESNILTNKFFFGFFLKATKGYLMEESDEKGKKA